MPIFDILGGMEQKLQKEKILYETIIKTKNDKDFIVSFHDYLSFISKEGIELCYHLNEPIKERDEEKNKLESLYSEIVTSTKEAIKNLEIFLKKENLEKDPVFEDRLMDAKSLINNTMYVLDGERLDSIHSELSDIMRRLLELGFEKELSKYVRKDKNSKLNTEDIIALEKRKQFISEKNNFNNKDTRSLAGVFFRLVELYLNIDKAENSNGNKIRVEKLFEDLHERNKETEYTKLMSGNILDGSYFKKDKYMSDIERFHQSIVMNNLETDKKENKTGSIFSLKSNDIYHYEIGKLSYKMTGLKEPKYIKMFKNIITYMPDQKDKIRVIELEKNINKKDKCGNNYRINLGKSAKPFNNFLKKNGVKNIHPDKKEPILSVTDEYITFYNKI